MCRTSEARGFAVLKLFVEEKERSKEHKQIYGNIFALYVTSNYKIFVGNVLFQNHKHSLITAESIMVESLTLLQLTFGIVHVDLRLICSFLASMVAMETPSMKLPMNCSCIAPTSSLEMDSK